MRSPLAAERGEPPARFLEKRRRRHRDQPAPGPQRTKQHANQPHVVMKRQPAHHHGFLCQTESHLYALQVVNEVSVRDDNTFGITGRSGRVLQKSGIVRARLKGPGERRIRLIEQLPVRNGDRFDTRKRSFFQSPLAESDPRATIGGQRPQPDRVTVAARGGRGYRYHTGTQTTQKSRQKLRRGMKDEESPVPWRNTPTQNTGPRPSPPVYVPPRTGKRFRFTRCQPRYSRQPRIESRFFADSVG